MTSKNIYKTWEFTFEDGSRRTIKARTLAEAKRFVLSKIEAYQSPKIFSIASQAA